MKNTPESSLTDLVQLMEKCFDAKVLLSVSLSLILSSITQFIDKYLFSDWEFFMPLCMLVFIDTVLAVTAVAKNNGGLVSAFMNRKITSGKFSKLLIKALVYGCLLIVAHQLGLIAKQQGYGEMASYARHAIYISMLLREIMSIIENSQELGHFFGSGFLEKITSLYKKGEGK